MADDKKITISFNRSFVIYALVFFLVLIVFLLGSLQSIPQQFLSPFYLKPSPTITLSPVPPSPTLTPTITLYPSITSGYVPRIGLESPDSNNLNNSDQLVKCSINEKCGGGIKQMKKEECNNTICCQVGNNWITVTKDECNTLQQQDENKYQKHNTCDSSGRCIAVEGGGSNECSTDMHCRHYECKGLKCEQVVGKGDSSCDTTSWVKLSNPFGDVRPDPDCAHTICQDNSCKVIEGRGSNECFNHYECSK